MGIEFERTTEPSGLILYDRIEQRQLQVRTAEPVDPVEADTDAFCFPVDAAYRFETSTLVFNQRYSVHLHEPNGQAIRGVEVGDDCEIDDRVGFIGLDGPIKLYCAVPSTGRIDAGIDAIQVQFPEPTTVSIGARSVHKHPAGTIRTPADPPALATALSALGSALKTTSPERAWPTLRGHPPLLELDDELSIPASLDVPDTDVSIVVEPTLGDLYAVSPLAFYLGAEIELGSAPAIETPRNRYELGVESSLESDVARTLKGHVLLDCIVRSEGLYRDTLYERTALESSLPFDVGALYDQPLVDRLDAYMGVSDSLLEPYLPRWQLTAYVPPTPASVEIIPFVVNELGVIRSPRGRRSHRTPSTVVEGEVARSVRAPEDAGGTPGVDPARTMVEPTVTDDAVEHAWFGGDVPIGATKATIEAFRNQLVRTDRSKTTTILIVCNDARMLGEHDTLDAVYGNRDELPFAVESKFGVSTDELATLLTDGGYDFFHYIGHATPDGLRCTDGDLDVRTLPTVDCSAFFLNACQSYEQGLALTRRGAFGGIVTLDDIVNTGAVEAGETVARLLNLGFPLRTVLELTRETTDIGGQYLIVGDGSADIGQAIGGTPSVIRVSDSGGAYDVHVDHYSTKVLGVGAVSSPHIESVTDYHLVPCSIDVAGMSTEELESYLLWIQDPVLYDDAFRWNDDLGAITFE